MTSDITASLAPQADAGKSPEQLLAERSARFEDASALRKPDRIPIFMPVSFFLADWGGVSHQQLLEDHDKRQQLLERAALHFQPDSILGVFNDPRAALALGDRMTKWPGHGLPETGSFQFAEHEFMTGDDYDAFLKDPADWTIRTYLPRAFSQLEGLALLPPLAMAAFGTYNLLNLGVLRAPPVAAALKALAAAAEEQAAADAWVAESGQRLAALGFPPPPLVGSLIEAPFDFMSDTLRGMRGVMTDILRRQAQLLEAEDRVLEIQLEHAISFARTTGLPYAFIPLHRGSDGFMSIAQFERFYWPQLRQMQLRLIENQITPVAFYEGVWNKRLDYVAELPAGKIHRLVPGQRHLQGQGGRGQDALHHGRNAQLAAAGRHRRGDPGDHPRGVPAGRRGRRVHHVHRHRRDGRLQAGACRGLGAGDPRVRERMSQARA